MRKLIWLLLITAAMAQNPPDQANTNWIVVGNEAQPIAPRHRKNIQDSISAAGTSGIVVIPPDYAFPAETFTNPNNILIFDFRPGTWSITGGGANFFGSSVSGTPNQINARSGVVSIASPVITPGGATVSGELDVMGNSAIEFNPDNICGFYGKITQNQLCNLDDLLVWNPQGVNGENQLVLTAQYSDTINNPPVNGSTYAWNSQDGMLELQAPAAGSPITGVAKGSALVANGVAQPAVYQTKNAIDPRDYGVDCTDTNDSTTQWAAAVAAAGNFGKIVVPIGCLFKLSGATGWALYKVYGLEIEFAGRQGNGCDTPQSGVSGIDYRQAYASGNKVVSIVDSQRLLFKNLTIYTNGGADTGIDLDQDGLVPPITTRDDFYNVCIYNNTATRNSSWNGFRISFTAASNVENIHLYHPDVTCSQLSPTSSTSNGNAIYWGNSANLKNEIVDDYRTTNCSQDIQNNFGSDLTWQFGLASNSWLNVAMGGFNDVLYGFRSENAQIPLQINNSHGPHLVEHNDFAGLAGPSPIDCPIGCGQVTLINNETDGVPTNWFNVHNNPGSSGPLIALGNRFFSYNPLEWEQGGSFVVDQNYGFVNTFNALLTPSESPGLAGSNVSSPILQFEDVYAGPNFDDYYIQAVPNNTVLGTPSASTLLIGHNPSSSITPWLAFPGNMSGITEAQVPTPSAPTLTTIGAAGSTSYSYVVVAHGGVGTTVASSTATIATGNATLTGGNAIHLFVTSTAGCTYFDVYRTASAGVPASTGKIGTRPCYAITPSTDTGGNLTFLDTGLVGDSTTPPVANTTGQIVSTVPIGVAPFVITSTTPVANLTVSKHPQVYEAGVLTTAEKIYTNTQALTAGAATHTLANSFSYTSSATFGCSCTDQTAANSCKAVPASATTVTLAGTSTDVLWLSCSGH